MVEEKRQGKKRRRTIRLCVTCSKILPAGSVKFCFGCKPSPSQSEILPSDVDNAPKRSYERENSSAQEPPFSNSHLEQPAENKRNVENWSSVCGQSSSVIPDAQQAEHVNFGESRTQSFTEFSTTFDETLTSDVNRGSTPTTSAFARNYDTPGPSTEQFVVTSTSTDQSLQQTVNHLHELVLYTLVDDSYFPQPISSDFQKLICSHLFLPMQTNVTCLSWSFPNIPLSRIVPDTTAHIPSNGNCLFAALAFSIGASQNCLMSLRQLICDYISNMNVSQNHLRASVRLSGDANNVEIQCTSVTQYLLESKMYEDGVFGTDLEIRAFAQLTGIDVFVFTASVGMNSWFVYKAVPNLVSNRAIYLHHSATHFQPVTHFCLMSNNNLSSGIDLDMPQTKTNDGFMPSSTNQRTNGTARRTTQCQSNSVNSGPIPPDDESPNVHISATECKKKRGRPPMKKKKRSAPMRSSTGQFVSKETAKRQDAESTKHSLLQENSLYENLSDISVDDLAPSDVSEEDSKREVTSQPCFMPDKCAKCCRVSTEEFPLDLQTYRNEGFKRKQAYGKPLPSGTSNVLLCSLCYRHLTAKKVKFHFSYPCVLWTFFTNESLWKTSDISVGVFLSWWPASVLQNFVFSLMNDPSVIPAIKLVVSSRKLPGALFTDITHDLKQFKEDIDSGDKLRMRDCLNRECFERVKCPWGCWEHLENVGFIGFQHFLNYHFPDFTTFGASSGKYLRGIRLDYTDNYLHLEKFLVQPAICIDKSGLSICACKNHARGSALRYVHAPNHPITENLATMENDRLALVKPSPRMIKCAKANQSVYTYQLVQMNVSFRGSNTLRLSSDGGGKWNNKQSELQDAAEQLAYTHRHDIRTDIREKMSKLEVPETVVKQITGDKYLPTDERICKALSGTTHIDLQTAAAMKKHNEVPHQNVQMHDRIDETNIQEQTNVADATSVNENAQEPEIAQKLSVVLPFLPIVRTTDSHGQQPPFPKFQKNGFYLSMASTMLFGSPLLWISLYKSSKMGNKCSLAALQFSSMHFSSPQKLIDKRSKIIPPICQLFNKPATSTLQATISDLLAHAENVKHIHSNSRSSLNQLPQLQTDGVDIIVQTVTSRSTRSAGLPDFELKQSSGKTYSLSYIAHVDALRNKFTIYLRYGNEHNLWWKYVDTSKVPIKVHAEEMTTMYSIRSNWNIAIYTDFCNKDSKLLHLEYLKYLGGQTKFFCRMHETPLTIDYAQSQYKCSLNDCNRHSRWRCPANNCSAGVCRQHFSSNTSEDFQYIDPREIISDTEECEQSENEESGSDVSDNYSSPETHFAEDEDLPDNDDNFLNFATDAGVIPEEFPLIDDDNFATTDSGVLPQHISSPGVLTSHVLINEEGHALKRNNFVTKISTKQRRILQNLVATSKGKCVPLLYPEAMLFTYIFWKQYSDGSYAGAIPSPLFGNEKENGALGFAGIENHILTRLMDGNLLTSSDLRYIQWCFDIMANTHLSHNNTQFILQRGLEHLHKSKYCQLKQDVEGRMKFGEADARRVVKELSAALRSNSSTYFFTFTCNMSTQFGVAPVYLAVKEYYKDASKEIQDAGMQAEMIILLRCWERASRYFMKWLETSQQEPLGPVLKLWYRYEFQTTAGNFPHIHAIVWTPEDKESDEVKQRVKCSTRQFRHDIWQLIDGELVTDAGHAEAILENMSAIQSHSCVKAGYRCHKKKDANGYGFCRYPLYPVDHYYTKKEIPANHDDEAWCILERLQLAEYKQHPIRDEGYWEICNELKRFRHLYPADYGEHISPTNVPIFVLCGANCNLLLTDPNLEGAYMAKYVAGKEEHEVVSVTAGSNSNEFKTKHHGMQNTKITGSKINFENRMQKDRKKNSISGLVVSSAECIWWLLGLPYSYSSMDFIHLPTVPLEFRGAMKLGSKTSPGSSSIGTGQSLPAVQARLDKNFPSWRCFSINQQVLINDATSSQYSVDKVTIFGLRPPELLFLDSPLIYFRLFCRTKLKKPKKERGTVHSVFLLSDEQSSPWIDGLGFQVQLRRPAVVEFMQYVLSNYRESVFPVRDDLKNAVAICSSNGFLQNSVFISQDRTISRTPAEVVTSTILPHNTAKFLIHLVLSMGRFETELDVFAVSSLKKSFEKAGLVRDYCHVEEEEVKNIMLRYLKEQLLHIPGGYRSFDKNLKAAYKAITDLLLFDVIDYAEPPAVLNSVLRDKADDKYIDFENTLLNPFIEALLLPQHNVVNAPFADELKQCTKTNPLGWVPVIQQQPTQSLESLAEQRSILNSLIETVNMYGRGAHNFFRHLFLIGPPGSGKTFLLTNIAVYCFSTGLQCMLTSLPSERSRKFGGVHLHKLFRLSVNQSVNPSNIAETAIAKLEKDKLRYLFIERLEVLFIEEVGLVSAELWSAIDLICQHVKKSCLPFGGVLVIGTGDTQQLPNISGSLLWSSPIMLTNFKLFVLEHYVRMSADTCGQELLQLLGNHIIDDENAQNVCEIISENCTFTDTWESFARHCEYRSALKVFGKRAAVRESIERQLQYITHERNIQQTCRIGEDEVTYTSSSVFVPATPSQTRTLNNEVSEPYKLVLYENAIYRITVNDTSLGISQGQMCTLAFVPLDDDPHVTVYVAPPGVRHLPATDHRGRTNFETHGWRRVKLNKRVGHLVINNNQKLRRCQYPLAYFIAATLHRIMGDTLGLVATQISTTRIHSLWLKSQIFVLISRVKFLKDVIFVGNKEETLIAIKQIIQKQTQWDSYVSHLVCEITKQRHPDHVPILHLETRHVFRPYNTEIPSGSVGFVYLLISVRKPRITYVGKTISLKRRLYEHNHGSGAKETADPTLMPWGVLAYLTGFDVDKGLTVVDNQMKQIESEWHSMNQVFHGNQATPTQMIDIAKDLAIQFKPVISGIMFVQSGKVVSDPGC